MSYHYLSRSFGSYNWPLAWSLLVHHHKGKAPLCNLPLRMRCRTCRTPYPLCQVPLCEEHFLVLGFSSICLWDREGGAATKKISNYGANLSKGAVGCCRVLGPSGVPFHHPPGPFYIAWDSHSYAAFEVVSFTIRTVVPGSSNAGQPIIPALYFLSFPFSSY